MARAVRAVPQRSPEDFAGAAPFDGCGAGLQGRAGLSPRCQAVARLFRHAPGAGGRCRRNHVEASRSANPAAGARHAQRVRRGAGRGSRAGGAVRPGRAARFVGMMELPSGAAVGGMAGQSEPLQVSAAGWKQYGGSVYNPARGARRG